MPHSDTGAPTIERTHEAEPPRLQVPASEASTALEAEPRRPHAPASSTRREVVRPAVSAFGLLPGEFAIRTYLTNNYLTARDGGRHSIDALVTSATTLGPNEKFKLTTIQPDYTTIQTPLRYFVSAVGEGGLGGNFPASQVLQTERTALADDSLFVLFGPGVGTGWSYIRTFNEHYLTALGGGGKASNAFHTDATVASTWEAFWVLKSGDLGSGYRYAIRPTGTGGPGQNINFLTAEDGGGHGANRYPAVVHNQGLVPTWSGFTLLRQADGSYALQTYSGNYVTAVGGGGIAGGDNLHTDATQIQAWEKFRIVDQGNATYTIQTVSGFYLAVDTRVLDIGGISTRISDPNAAPQIGYTAKFELMMMGA
jgi:hypothetical protein